MMEKGAVEELLVELKSSKETDPHASAYGSRIETSRHMTWQENQRRRVKERDEFYEMDELLIDSALSLHHKQLRLADVSYLHLNKDPVYRQEQEVHQEEQKVFSDIAESKTESKGEELLLSKEEQEVPGTSSLLPLRVHNRIHRSRVGYEFLQKTYFGEIPIFSTAWGESSSGGSAIVCSIPYKDGAGSGSFSASTKKQALLEKLSQLYPKHYKDDYRGYRREPMTPSEELKEENRGADMVASSSDEEHKKHSDYRRRMMGVSTNNNVRFADDGKDHFNDDKSSSNNGYSSPRRSVVAETKSIDKYDDRYCYSNYNADNRANEHHYRHLAHGGDEKINSTSDSKDGGDYGYDQRPARRFYYQ